MSDKKTPETTPETAPATPATIAALPIVRPCGPDAKPLPAGAMIMVGMPGTNVAIPVDAERYADRVLKGIEKASARLAYEMAAKSLNLK